MCRATRVWKGPLEKLPEVETAKALMTEAVSWSVMRWLHEKKRVRKTADQANAALDQLSQMLRHAWPNAAKAAYEALATQATRCTKIPHTFIDSEVLLIAKKVRDADDEAYRARMDAEETFDEAE